MGIRSCQDVWNFSWISPPSFFHIRMKDHKIIIVLSRVCTDCPALLGTVKWYTKKVYRHTLPNWGPCNPHSCTFLFTVKSREHRMIEQKFIYKISLTEPKLSFINPQSHQTRESCRRSLIAASLLHKLQRQTLAFIRRFVRMLLRVQSHISNQRYLCRISAYPTSHLLFGLHFSFA